MPRAGETVLSHRGQFLHKYIHSFIVLDPKFIKCGKIKIGDTVTGHVVFTNKKVLSCRGIHITLMGRSVLHETHQAYHQSMGTDFLIKDGKTQNGIRMTPNAVPKGTHKFPFSLLIPDSAMMVPSFQFSYAELHYEIQTIVYLKTGSIYKASSMPVKISDYVNIGTTTEFSSPIRHWIQGNLSLFNPSARNNIRVLLESPRSAYSSEEEIPIMMEFQEGDYQTKIKSIKLSLVKRNLHSVVCRPQCEDETVIVSKTITDISKCPAEVLIIPKGLSLSQSYDFVCIGKWEGIPIGEVFRVTQAYCLKIVITPNGFGASLSDEIPIVIGTDNVPLSSSCLSAASFTRSLGNRCVWNSCTGSQVSLLPAYSELSLNSCRGKRRDSTSSFETLPPTFEEALNLKEALSNENS